MGHLSYLAASDLTAHPISPCRTARTRAVAGDDHCCASSAIHCKLVHVQGMADGSNELTCSFDTIPTCTPSSHDLIAKDEDDASAPMRSTWCITTRLALKARATV